MRAYMLLSDAVTKLTPVITVFQYIKQDIGKVKNWLDENRLKLCDWSIVDDLLHLRRGGECPELLLLWERP